MTDFVSFSVNLALVICVLLIAPCVHRLYVGPTVADRLQATDIITTLLIGIIVLLTLARNDSHFFDISLVLAVFSFVGTLVTARFIAEGRDY